MRKFVALFRSLEEDNGSTAKIDAIIQYLKTADDEDKLWALALFAHRRPKRPVTSTQLRLWAAEMAGIPLWLFEDTYHIVGDLAETISLLVPQTEAYQDFGLKEVITELIYLAKEQDEVKKAKIGSIWRAMDADSRFLFNKIMTGGFRVGVSQKIFIKAIAKHYDLEENAVEHRLMGDWSAQDTTWHQLLFAPSEKDLLSKPFPFYLAHALEVEPEALGDIQDWVAEWKWDGIRGQIIKRKGEIFIWSRGEELITPKFPELCTIVNTEEDNFVIDGEIVAYKDGAPLDFNVLQTRIGRKNLSVKQAEACPISFIAYDLLQYGGIDLRDRPLAERKQLLEKLLHTLNNPNYITSPVIEADSWQELVTLQQNSRNRNAEGLMLKLKNGIYQQGRKKGEWWKWKVDPYSVDAVLLYAQRGHGRRASLFTDFTFAVWQDEKLVPFTKAYTGLTDAEFTEITKFVKENTIERFGPVTSVKPTLVFELAFEGINLSSRHKCGIALRFPRIKRWRQDKKASEADHLHDLKALLK